MNETISQINVNGTLYDIEAVGGGSVSSVVGQTGAITAEQVATALTSAGYALSNPDISIAADSGTSQLDMTANTVYKVTAGDKSFIFKTPADSNTDVKVQQNAAITTAGAYPIILAYSTATSKVTNAVNKSANLTYNPNTKALVTGGTVDGYTLAAASAKSVDTSISAGSSSANLPTSAAVAAFVEGKGYITTDNNTWRKVQLDGVDMLGTGTNTNPLNIKAGSNMTITESNGTFTFSSSFTDSDTNTAQLQVSDTTNKRINTAESTGKYIQFTGGTDKFTVSDGTNSFDVAVSHTNDGDTKVQADWDQTDSTAADYIKNKPVIVSAEHVTVTVTAPSGVSVAGGTVTLNGDTYTLDNTGIVEVDIAVGIEYTATLGYFSGYANTTTPMVYTASLPSRNIALEYTLLPNGVYAYYNDGSLRTEGTSDAIGVAVITSTNKFVISKACAVSRNWGLYGTSISNIVTSTTESTAISDFDGEGNTTKLINAYGSDAEAASWCRNQFNGKGYLPSAGEFSIVLSNSDSVLSIMNSIGSSMYRPEGVSSSYAAMYWTSTLYDASNNTWQMYYESTNLYKNAGVSRGDTTRLYYYTYGGSGGYYIYVACCIRAFLSLT